MAPCPTHFLQTGRAIRVWAMMLAIIWYPSEHIICQPHCAMTIPNMIIYIYRLEQHIHRTLSYSSSLSCRLYSAPFGRSLKQITSWEYFAPWARRLAVGAVSTIQDTGSGIIRFFQNHRWSRQGENCILQAKIYPRIWRRQYIWGISFLCNVSAHSNQACQCNVVGMSSSC